MHLGELRFVIEQLEVRRPARHAEVDDPLRLRGDGLVGALGQGRVGIQERGQGQATDPLPRAVQETASIQVGGKVTRIHREITCG